MQYVISVIIVFTPSKCAKYILKEDIYPPPISLDLKCLDVEIMFMSSDCPTLLERLAINNIRHPSLKREDRLRKHPFAGFGTVMEDIKRSAYTKNQPILLASWPIGTSGRYFRPSEVRFRGILAFRAFDVKTHKKRFLTETPIELADFWYMKSF